MVGNKLRTDTINGKISVVLFWEECRDCVSMRVRLERDDGYYYLEPAEVNFKKRDIGERIEPFLSFHGMSGQDFLNGLAEGLIGLGFAPDKMEQLNGELKATKYHLEDMRNLTFKAHLPPQVKE